MYNDEHDVEILADRRIILNGKKGAQDMLLTLKIWKHVCISFFYFCCSLFSAGLVGDALRLCGVGVYGRVFLTIHVTLSTHVPSRFINFFIFVLKRSSY